MKSFRNRLRSAVLSVLPVAAAACSAPHGSGTSTTASATSAAAASSAGATSSTSTAGSGTIGGSSGGSSGGGTTTSTNLCAECVQAGEVCNVYATACVDPCATCDCTHSFEPIGPTDGGYPDGGLPLELCKAACPNPDATPGADPRTAIYWTVLSCQIEDGGCQALPDGGAAGQECVDCKVETDCGSSGRAPAGLRAPQPVPPPTPVLGAYFARMAHLEAASVTAFGRLASELERHEAPPELVARARAAAREEEGHAAQVGALAHRFGGRPPAVVVEDLPERALVDLAIENAVEGCVRETFGAALCQWQAARARDPEVREVMTRLARDEASHAELAWDLAGWLEPHLDPAQRRALEAARARAITALPTGDRPNAELVAHVGSPLPDEASAIIASLSRSIWDVRETG